ncbi:MAG: fibronectin type III domain-containing protein [Acidobacteriota bacterium]|nr:fibronectin type III domain-containing protein [Acidobacteriota bacterium]
MVKLCIATALLLLMVGCHSVDSGTSPSFSSSNFSVVALNESQIQVSWTPGADDLLPSSELKYRIWYGTTVDTTGAPNIVTDAGALSWTLTGLEAATTYEVLVTAYDFGQDSEIPESNATKSATTSAAGEGTFDGPLTFDLSQTPTGLITGSVQTNGTYIGVLANDRLDWYFVEGNEIKEFNDEDIDLETAIDQAALVKTRTGTTPDDLFLVTATGLRHYENSTNDGFENTPFTDFEGVPEPDSMGFIYTADGIMDLVYYLDAGGIVRFYDYDETATDQADRFTEKATYNLGAVNVQFRVGDFDGDAATDHDYGIVYLQLNELWYVQGDADFNFEAREEIATIDQFTQTVKVLVDGQVTNEDQTIDYNSSTMTATLEVFARGSTDSDLDIHIFFRDESNDLSQLYVYTGNTAGTFDDATVKNYDQITYNFVDFQDADGANGLDLVAPQDAANNVALHLDASGGIDKAEGYYGYGGDDLVTYAVFGQLDGSNRSDLVMTSGQTLSVLLWNE